MITAQAFIAQLDQCGSCASVISVFSIPWGASHTKAALFKRAGHDARIHLAVHDPIAGQIIVTSMEALESGERHPILPDRPHEK